MNETEELPDDLESSQNNQIEKLEEEVEEILHELPADKRGKLLAVFSNVTAHYEGPIPPPSILKGYEDVLVGCADRIVAMAELEQKFRHAMVAKNINSENWLKSTGLKFGFVLAFALLVGSMVLIGMEKDAQGFALILGAAGAFVGLFIFQGRKQKQE